MSVGKKFWAIDTTGNYSPGANPGVSFGGNINGTTITGVDAAVVTAIAGLTPGTNPVGIAGNYIPAGTRITAASGTALTISRTAGTAFSSNLLYWDAKKPSTAGGDAPITNILCLDSTHGTFSFIDSGGKTATIPASTLVKGSVYEFQVGNVVTITSGDFIGYSAS